MKRFYLPLIAAGLLASHCAIADNWDIFGKWETTYSNQDSTHTVSLNSRIMADKSHTNGSYQWHLQTNYLNSNRPLKAVSSNHYQFDSLASHLQQGNQRLSLSLDRFNSAIFTDTATWVFGRQAISLGQSLLFTPLALGNQLAIPSLDTEYAPGVDAISGDIWLDNGNLQLIAAFGSSQTDDTVNWDGSALLSRYTSHLGNLEWAWQLGKINQAYIVGGGVSGDQDGIAYRLELAHTKPQSSLLHGQAFTTWVAGLGYQANDDLHLEIEYLSNGGANTVSYALARLQAGMIASANQAMLGATASYQINPLLIMQATHFKGLTDKSQFTQLGVSYSISDNSNIDFSSTLYNGTSTSEFGALSDTHTLTYRSYF
jgi:hypothetical protein